MAPRSAGTTDRPGPAAETDSHRPTPGARRADHRVVLLAALVAHLAAATVHGVTHGLVPVPLPAWQNAVVVGTTFLGPVAGVALARRDHPAGVPLFAASMAAALLVGVTLHAVVENPDNLRAIPAGPWQFPFRASAVAVAVTSAAGTAVGAWYWRADAGARQ